MEETIRSVLLHGDPDFEHLVFDRGRRWGLDAIPELANC